MCYVSHRLPDEANKPPRGVHQRQQGLLCIKSVQSRSSIYLYSTLPNFLGTDATWLNEAVISCLQVGTAYQGMLSRLGMSHVHRYNKRVYKP